MILIVLVFLLFMVFGFPIVVSLGFSSVVYLLTYGPDLTTLVQRMMGGVDKFVLMAIPFFILAGNMMNSGGSTRRIFNFANSLVGHFPGGVAHVNVVASMIFAGMSGSALADAAGLGTVEIKAMKDRGFPPAFTAALTAASATVGPIIPPSTSFVIYGALAQMSVGKLFLGGFVPGIFMGVSLMILIIIIDYKRKFPRSPRASLSEIGSSFLSSIPVLGTPLIIVGAIASGIATPTEAGAIAVIYAILTGVFIYREMTLRNLYKALLDSVWTTASIMIIVSTATVLGWILIIEDLPGIIASHLLSISSNPKVIILLLNVALLLLGCFIEDTSIMVISIPLIRPLAAQLGLDPIHLGVIVVLNLMIGLSTPPFGLLLFTVSGVANIPVERVIKQILPFFIPLVIVLLLLSLVPELVTYIPYKLMGK